VFTGVIKSSMGKSNAPRAMSGPTVDWYDMGLSGFGVSSILPDESGEYVYAGTNKGEIYRAKASITSVKSVPQIPSKFVLKQNYPNPFGSLSKAKSNNTTIEYVIPSPTFVTITIYNVLGEKIENLVHAYRTAGDYKVNFDAEKLPSGVYFYAIKAGNFTSTRKMLLIK